MDTVGQQIKQRRLERGWSQAELGVYSGSSQPTINQIETGKRNPSTKTLQKIADALETPVSDLFPKVGAPSSEVEERRRILHSLFGSWARFLESLHAQIAHLFNTLPNEPTREEWVHGKEQIEQLLTVFFLVQTALVESNTGGLYGQYFRAIERGETVPDDVREAVVKLNKFQNAIYVTLIPMVTEWIRSRDEGVQRATEIQEEAKKNRKNFTVLQGSLSA